MREIKNACISSTLLGYEDHGILTYFLYVDYGGEGQGFGGYALDNYDKLKGERIGCAYGTQTIIEILKIIEVDRWEELKGKMIRVDADYSQIYGIGNILKDKWFYPENLEKKE